MRKEINFFQGELLSDDQFKEKFSLSKDKAEIWSPIPLNTIILLSAIEKFREELLKKGQIYQELSTELLHREDVHSSEVESYLETIIDFMKIDHLRKKIERELRSEFPFEIKRIDPRSDQFEAWYPLGTIVHVTPSNAPVLSVFSVLEGLLSGNVNILKLGRKDGGFASMFFHELIRYDSTQTLKNYIYIGKISSSQKNELKDLLSVADVVSAWGNEESIKSIRDLSPASARIVEWGHKISFAYITHSMRNDEDMLTSLAKEICLNDQLACSSPQCVYLEDGRFDELVEFAKKLEKKLNHIEFQYPSTQPSSAETAEITIKSEQVRLDSIQSESLLIKSTSNTWRLFVENKPGLNASPLFRSLWIKPMPKGEIIKQLRPLKMYLQTVGIWANQNEVEDLTNKLFRAGAQRVRVLGEMLDSYVGEPHDGVYALERFCQRISFNDGSQFKLMKEKFSFEANSISIDQRDKKIMQKQDFQNQKIENQYAQMYFYSGGSSGEPKLSVFTYEDYHRQMELAAEGLYAAGFEPNQDRAMNLFYAGSLYGGFVSFFTILEKLRAFHFPMGANADFEMVGKSIVKNKVDTLLGMPSYIMQLFEFNKDLFKSYRGIKKIFFGGEHFSLTQRNYLKNEFGVFIVRSASYGSVDAGPLGYQCAHCEGGIHHLHDRLHDIEVVEMESDISVKNGEVGRFLFTSKVRHGQKIVRYEIGDVGRILKGNCPCGRTGIRFELLGRSGDVVRIGTVFLSYQKFEKHLSDHLLFEGAFQLHLLPGNESKREKVLIKMETPTQKKISQQDLVELLLSIYNDLNDAVVKDKVLDFEIEYIPREKLEVTSTTSKLRRVIDHRMNL